VISCVANSPNRQHIIVSGKQGVCLCTPHGETLVLNRLPFLTHGVNHVAFLPSGNSFLRHNKSPYFSSYDTATKQAVTLSEGDGTLKPAYYSSRFTLSPNGSQLAVESGYTIRIYDILQARLLSTTFSLDSTIVLSILTNNRILLWDTSKQPTIGALLKGHNGNLEHLAIASDNSVLLGVTERGIYLWDLSKRRLNASGSFEGLGPIVSASFAANHRAIVTTHRDGNMYLWNQKGQELKHQPADSNVSFDSSSASYLDVDEDHPREIGRGMRWFPAKKSGSGLWALLDGYLIIGRENGTVTVMPVPEVGTANAPNDKGKSKAQ
jgi:WD40 repeat protein